MKTFIIIIFCFLFASSVIPQSTFKYLYSSPLNEISKSLFEDNDGNIYFAVKNYNYALIIKLDYEGLFLDSISIYNPEGSCNLEELIKIDDDHFVALGNWKSDTISELWYVLFDINLEIESDKRLDSYGLYIFDFQHIINHNGNIVFIADYMPPQSDVDVCMYEITTEGQVLRSTFFNTIYEFNSANSLLENNYDSIYKVFTTRPLGPLSSRMPCFINLVDSNFNLLDYSLVHNLFINSRASAKWVNDSTYLLAGKWYVPYVEEWDIGILQVNREDSVLLSASFGKPDTVDWAGNYKCLDFISNNNIFFVGSSNTYTYPFQIEPSWIMVNILDSNLNLKSQQFYGGDASYFVNSILATQDSGCLISCSRYDYLTQHEENDVYILKVNQDGLLVSTPENPVINTKTCYIFPNPGNDLLNINSPKDGLQIQLFNVTGKRVGEVGISSGTNSISVSSLAPGIYFYQITDQKRENIQTGKWIKR
jgi:hypothetical protein